MTRQMTIPQKTYAGLWPGLEVSQDYHPAGPPEKTQGNWLA